MMRLQRGFNIDEMSWILQVPEHFTQQTFLGGKIMKKFIQCLVISLILVAMLIVPLAGCTQNAPEQAAPNNDNSDVTPDANNDEIDLSEHVDLVMYLLGDPPSDLDRVLAEINKLAEEELNATLTMEYIPWSDMGTRYSLILSSGEKCDLMFTGDWAYYLQEATKGAFNEITMEKLEVKGLSKSFGHAEVLHDISLIDICKDDDVLNIYLSSEYSGVVGGGDAVLFFVTAEKKHFKNIYDVNINIKENDSTDPDVAYKPIIYLYPEIERDISIKLGFKDNITVSYPKYNDGWKVKAKPDGTLIEYGTNRELYALYYENLNAIDFNIKKDGFVVSKEDVVPFLEEKLEILGLNSKEIQEFIIYWLPILEKNKYNYIRFATNEEIEQNMPLNIEPSPDTIIRVLMTFKGLDEQIDVSEQELVTPIRNGYTVVEWGATIIK